jgi:crotonobetainyl-CoA:carnitine CoA-transferase CaiB-like acyl-CoA transferase
VGGHEGLRAAPPGELGAPVDRPVPELPHRRRLGRRRCAKQSLWLKLCDALGQPELAEDARFADFAGRDEHRDELLAILDAAFAERSTDDWLEALRDAGVPSGRVNDVAAALDDEQAAARDAVVTVEHPRLGAVREVASPLRVGNDERPLRPGPARGEHTDAVLRELCGYDEARVDELRRAGVFGGDAA